MKVICSEWPAEVFPYRDEPGVYILYGAIGEVVYVGCTKHVKDRLKTHSKDERFSEVKSYEVRVLEDYNEVRKLEKTLIKELAPSLNQRRYDKKSLY